MNKLIQVLLASVCLLSVNSLAQTMTDEQLRQARQASESQRVDLNQYMNQTSRNARAGVTSLPNQTELPVVDEEAPPPFGANLFTSGIESQRTDGLNDNYLVAAGDKISVQLWGAVELAEVLTVDTQGNIFIPQVGPVRVMDVAASKVNNVVTSKVKSIYTNNVNVYVNLLTSTPVGVFVAGPVLRPGQYAGLASDSVLHYLKRAGGIDPDRGSYRKVSVLRDDEIVTTYDLYEFLRQGRLPAFSFKDGDVILVSEQGAVVTVDGAARYLFRFELKSNSSSGEDLMYFARPLSKTTHVAVTGNRQDGPISVYFSVDDFKGFVIEDGDEVLFNDDLRPQVISVQVSGSYLGPSYYSVKKDARLLDVLEYIEVDPSQADIGSIYIKRKSVAQQQKQMLEDSLQRLERSIFTAPASSDGESRIRAQEAELVMQFVERARQIEPHGKVILSQAGNVANIRLEQGDEIVIPAKTDLVQISGEVLLPQAVVYNEDALITDYVAWAGGYSERADDRRIAIVHPNGLTTFIEANGGDYWFGGDEQSIRIQPGDQILVLPRIDTKLLQAVKDITQIVYQVALAANVAVNFD